MTNVLPLEALNVLSKRRLSSHFHFCAYYDYFTPLILATAFICQNPSHPNLFSPLAGCFASL